MKVTPAIKTPAKFEPFNITIETLEEAQRMYHLLNLCQSAGDELGANNSVPNPSMDQYPMWKAYDRYIEAHFGDLIYRSEAK